eukprot:TRINITY_DN16241_c0_g1_i2.p1 TRINITY_DN16241_c0_g1~~TRINITY_DN16241_c0_g1_i2.p1  ORF type:complete len:576 (+),score=58.66 TRINITY_DN16241_c0_g1_i2:76-1803(+)
MKFRTASVLVASMAAFWPCMGATPEAALALNPSADSLSLVASQLSSLLSESSTLQTAPNTSAQSAPNTEIATTMGTVLGSMISSLYSAHNRSLTRIDAAIQAINACANANGTNTMTAAACANHPACIQEGLTGNCCPATSGANLACCSSQAGVFLEFKHTETYEQRTHLGSSSPPLDRLAHCAYTEENITNTSLRCEAGCTTPTPTIPPGPQCDPLTCTANPNEGYKAYLTRMINMITSLENQLPVTPPVTDPLTGTDPCNCWNHTTWHIERTYEPGCCATRYQWEHDRCQHLESARNATNNYDSCYDSNLNFYNSIVQEALSEASSREAQMRAIKRMECLVNTFGTANQSAGIQVCINTNQTQTADVLAMKITPDPAPDKANVSFHCNREMIPGTTEFEAKWYSNLPAGIAACGHVVTCPTVCDATTTGTDASVSTSSAPVPVATPDFMENRQACYSLNQGYSQVTWDMGSDQTLGKVSLFPGAGIASIEVYLTSSSALLTSETKCGTIFKQTAPYEVNCAQISSAARYIVLKPIADVSCTSGCVQTWCDMKLGDAYLCDLPASGSGTQEKPCT